WAADNFEKTSLLVAAGADVNARSDDGQTPLLIAASYYGSKDVVKLLLDRGADPSIKVTNSTGEMTPLAEAAYAGDADVIQLLLDRGADPKKGGGFSLSYAAFSLCSRCVDLLMKRVDAADVSFALMFNLPPSNDPRAARLLLERGADIKATDPEGRNVL